jgi:hypothetical protein
MDNFRLGEVATEIAEPPTRIAEMESIYHRLKLLEERLNDLITLLLPARLEKLEERLNLMMTLKTANKLDLSKFTCDIPSLGLHSNKVELPLRKVEPNVDS